MNFDGFILKSGTYETSSNFNNFSRAFIRSFYTHIGLHQLFENVSIDWKHSDVILINFFIIIFIAFVSQPSFRFTHSHVRVFSRGHFIPVLKSLSLTSSWFPYKRSTIICLRTLECVVSLEWHGILQHLSRTVVWLVYEHSFAANVDRYLSAAATSIDLRDILIDVCKKKRPSPSTYVSGSLRESLQRYVCRPRPCREEDRRLFHHRSRQTKRI